MLDKENDYGEVLQKEIDWLKLSMRIDEHAHAGAYNSLLQNVASRLVLFLGILGCVNLLIIYYMDFLDMFHFILINLCLILIFIMWVNGYELKEKDKVGGIKNIKKEFRIKKFMVKNRYKGMGIDVGMIQTEFNELKEIY